MWAPVCRERCLFLVISAEEKTQPSISVFISQAYFLGSLLSLSSPPPPSLLATAMLRRYVMDVGRVTVRISSQYTFPLRLAEKQTFDMGRGESVSDKNKGSFSSLCLQRTDSIPPCVYRDRRLFLSVPTEARLLLHA